MDIEDKIQKLEEAAQKEGTEVGEYWGRLIDFWTSSQDYCTNDFKDAVITEIEEAYKDLNTNYEIIRQDFTETTTLETLSRISEGYAFGEKEGTTKVL